jgi:integrase/recombinase XerD
LVQTVARLYRKAHLTAVEARYVHQRVRQRLGLRTRPERAKRLPEILTPEELRRVLGQAYREHPRDGLIVRTLFETGLRVSELVRLEVTDVDFLEWTIAVREGKGGKDRLVLFTEDLGQQLRLHLADRTRGFLFESNRATAFTARRIQRIVKSIALRAGVAKKIQPHTYRHSMATFLRNQGVPLDVVQLLLGHADPRTTQLYARLSLASARQEYDRAMAGLAGAGANVTLPDADIRPAGSRPASSTG